MELADALSLLRTAQQVSVVRDREDITGIVKRAARQLSGAEGVTFVLRDGDQCYYVDEDAISPLWKGSRFPMEICISGWAMMHRQTVVIEDIYSDDRVPHEAYSPTFVQSLAMIPVRSADPIAAIGVYWATRHTATSEEIEVLQWLADITAVAIDNLQLINALESRVVENERNVKQLEAEVSRRETAENQFLQAQKMEAIGQLAGTIAHDFNNLLSVISASADLALDEMKDGESPDEHLETILGATESAASLTRQLLSFSRRQPVKKQAIDLAGAITRVRPMMERLLGNHVTLETDIESELGPVDIRSQPSRTSDYESRCQCT
ncbi:MAG: GAF domain-containing protein [Gammaproteobacteria bacterium]|nr:GAF domain-containing protein [Gammaproteobacteria bacterium]